MMSSLVTLFPLYLKKRDIDEVVMGTIITSVIVGTILSQVPVGHIADRFGKRRVLLICGVLLTGLFAIFPLHSSWWYFVTLGTLLGGVAGNLYPIGLAMIGGLVSKERLGAANSMFSLAFGTGSLMGPAVSGLAMTHLGDGWLFYLPSILCGAFCLELILLYRRTAPRRRRGNAGGKEELPGVMPKGSI
jgi:MFS family permease